MVISTREDIERIVNSQREFFLSGATLDLDFRIEQLSKLRASLFKHEQEIYDAMKKDLGRTPNEAYFCDIGPVAMEITEMIEGLRKWAKPERLFSGLINFPSITTKVYKMPYGVTLIISPFNFPLLLALGPLAAAIAGGNTAIMRSSFKSKACTEVLGKIIADAFPENYIGMVFGDHDVADMCLETRVDKIFYTGSPRVAKHIMDMAAKNLTPVALELGGETGNWCIIRADADIRDTARKVAFIKILNSGQICININQVAVAEEIADEFVACLKEEIERQIGANALENPEYPKLICQEAYEKCRQDVEDYKDRIVCGGGYNPETRQVAPTVLYPVGIDEDIVNRELFNPILPVVTYKDAEIDKLIRTVEEREHGLALYLFTKDVGWAKRTISTMQFGGGAINDVLVQIVVKGAPFGGTGHSGIGAYHGEWGFREFTHPSTVMFGHTKFTLPFREHPYAGDDEKFKSKLFKFFLK